MPKVVKVAIWILYLEYTFAIIISFVAREINFYSDDFNYEIVLLLLIPYVIIYLFSLGYNFARNICILIVFLILASAFFRLAFGGFHAMVGAVFLLQLFTLYLLYHKNTHEWLLSQKRLRSYKK